LHRTFEKQHWAMMLIATLAIADHRATIVNPKCLAAYGTIKRTEGCNRLFSCK
jgi:hypothetical protein